jgi:hypothetical protein
MEIEIEIEIEIEVEGGTVGRALGDEQHAL